MLSNAETQVAEYLKHGLSNKEIAEKLFVCEKTIKFHLTNIYKKQGVNSRMEFIARNNGTHQAKELILDTYVKPLEQGARALQSYQKTQEDKILFIDEKFKVGHTISHLHSMMKEVTKDEITPATVNAACNCVARLNETINTAIQAARFLNER